MRAEQLSNEHVVSALRHAIQSRIGAERYRLWFGSGVDWQIEEESVALLVENDFTLERLRRQFGREIQATLTSIVPRPMRLEYRVSPPNAAADQTRAAGSALDDAAVVPATSPSDDTSVVRSSAPTTGTKQRVGNSGRPVGLKVVGPDRASHDMSRTDGARTDGARTDGALRRRHSRFETFVVGRGNKVAVTAAQAVAERLGSVSPLFIYGPSGAGKTHLLESVWTSTRSRRTPVRSLLLSSEQFTTFFLEALQGSGLPGFRRKVRDVDLLLIDDIQFLAGKRATLVEFQHTLDSLLRQGRQLVVSSDRAPAELCGLGPELVARLTGGLVCGVELADYATRRGITQNWVARDGLGLPDEVVDLIALETNGDARQIRGALNRLHATSLALHQPITAELARTTLSDIFAGARRIVRLPDIERAVCETFGLEPQCLRAGGKSRSASQPRMLAMWLARKYTRMAFSEISEFFGRRSHSTVISAEQKVNRWVGDGARLHLGGSDWTVEEAIRRLESKLRTG